MISLFGAIYIIIVCITLYDWWCMLLHSHEQLLHLLHLLNRIKLDLYDLLRTPVNAQQFGMLGTILEAVVELDASTITVDEVLHRTQELNILGVRLIH